MRTGRFLRVIVTMMMLLMYGAAGEVWGQDIVNTNIHYRVLPELESGVSGTINVTSITKETEEDTYKRMVTITVAPEPGYIIRKEMITVERMKELPVASPAPRRAPNLAELIPLKYNDDEDADVAEAYWGNSRTYTFVVPNGYEGAYITATFVEKPTDETVKVITSLGEITEMNGKYKLGADITTSSGVSGTFTGELDGNFHHIIGLTSTLFTKIEGGTVKNLILENVNISGGDVGAIAKEVTGTSTKKASIYNCGVLSGQIGSGTSGYVGGLVGTLGSETNNDDCYARVINCYNFADIKGGAHRAGIVGYNCFASKANNIRTMVMNCMFYGDIDYSSGNIYPIYGGMEIGNDYNATNRPNDKLNNYNYFLYEAPYSNNRKITTYNCALAAEERFLVRFEFYRHLLNSTRELAAWYATDSPANAHNVMAKWVLDKSIAKYPILKPQGKYPSVVNYKPNNVAIDDKNEHRNEGRKLTNLGDNGMLHVTIRMTTDSTNISNQKNFRYPGTVDSPKATITKGSLDLIITDKDTANYNYNYGKVQLPYYNDVGTGNYTYNRVVTGWKIVAITAVDDPYTAANYKKTNNKDPDYDAPNYNFADRNSSNKDLYSVSGRIFSQGGYFNVPKGVTSITIEPYWGKAAYLSDACYDRYGYKNTDNLTQVGGGQRYINNTDCPVLSGHQKVFTTVSNALGALTGGSSPTVYDYAIVLVGNYHHHVDLGKSGKELSEGTTPFTIMSIDLNKDNEPDYCLIYRSGKNQKISPIRFDFITVPGMGMAHRMLEQGTADDKKDLAIPGNCLPLGWFEITTTGLIKYGQFEHSNQSKTNSPLIFMGGVIDQFVANNTAGADGNLPSYNNRTKYMLFGDNVWFKMLSNGTHMDNKSPTPHRPISLVGGEYETLYLSGYFRPDANACTDTNGENNAECYIDGGKFGEVAGAGQENIAGDVNWFIDHADIREFYGGGIKASNNVQVTGNITTEIKNSYVDVFCGGPKFGDMTALDSENPANNKKVHTTATDCVFGIYFGAGYGGTSITRECLKAYNKFENKNYNWNGWVDGTYHNSGADSYRGKFINGKGVSCGYEYEFFAGSAGNVARLYQRYANFSLAQVNDVQSDLTRCTIKGNLFGGGSLGKVRGTIISTLTNCLVKGSAFGAGYSASVPTASVLALGGFTIFDKETNQTVKTNHNYNVVTGVYEKSDFPSTTQYTWVHVESLGNKAQALTDNDDGTRTIKTTGNLNGLGTVEGKVTLNIEGTTVVEGNVFVTDEEGNVLKDVDGNMVVKEQTGGIYGGGDSSAAFGNTEVNFKPTARNGYTYNTYNIFGGGNQADVGGNTEVNIQSGVISKNVYGGGNLGSVGTTSTKTEHKDFDHEGETDEKIYGFGLSWPCEFTYEEGTGTATVNITGGKIGTTGEEVLVNGQTETNGDVYGGSKGAAGDRYEMAETGNVKTTVVNINYSSTPDNPESATEYIAGSVFGGGENGHVNEDTEVTITNGLIKHSVFGGGKGKGTYKGQLLDLNSNDLLPKSDVYSWTAGKVYGNTKITMSGGTVLLNIYGGGDMASVGKGNYAGGPDDYAINGYGELPPRSGESQTNLWENNDFLNSGKAEVIVTGGTLGDGTSVKDGLATGNIFGGCRGMAAPNLRKSPRYKYLPQYFFGYVNETEVTIGTAATPAQGEPDDDDYVAEVPASGPTVYGSVYGGGQDGHVRRDTKVTMFGGEIGKEYTGTARELANPTEDWKQKWRTRGNVYGSGSGLGLYDNDKDGIGESYSTSSGSVTHNTTVIIQGGTIHQNVYGGGALSSVGPPKIPTVTITERDPSPSTEHGRGEQTLNKVVIASMIGDANSYANEYGGNVYGASRGDASLELDANSYATSIHTEVNILEGGEVLGSVFAGGESGLTKVSNTLNMLGGNVQHDVYGGGELAAAGNTLVNLLGGTVSRDAFGGGFGRRAVGTVEAVDASAANATVYLNGIEKAAYKTVREMTAGDATELALFTTKLPAYSDEITDYRLKDDILGCIIGGRIFGCNNIYGSPTGNVKVHVFATQNASKATINKKFGKDIDISTLNDKDKLKGILGDKIALATALSIDATTAQATYDKDDYANDAAAIEAYKGAIETLTTAITTALSTGTEDEISAKQAAINAKRFDVKAVYGGGNLAACRPTIEGTPGPQVIIEGCYYTSIETVYGGGNAAPVPSTDVIINSDYEIDYVFGGGNGRENVVIYQGTSKEETVTNNGADVGIVQDGDSKYDYGTGIANTTLNGGTINNAFAGSDKKGNIRGGTNLQIADAENTECPLDVKELYGAGREAEQEGGVTLVLGCVKNLGSVYGGAMNANIKGGVDLVITSGKFDKVFGGNNLAGTIQGPITLSIEETACDPIEIGELYLGGNQAGYSVYGYKKVGDVIVPRESENDGDVATGTTAPPSGGWRDPILNIVSCTSIGKVFGGGFEALMVGNPTVNINMIPGEHAIKIDRDGNGTPDGDENLLGEIGDVFGGGNEADVYGNTTVNIATETTVTLKSTRDTHQVVGAYITGNIYGGGNLGHVGKFTPADTDAIITADINDHEGYGAFATEYKLKLNEPYSCEGGTGTCTVNISGNAEIGPDNQQMKTSDRPDDRGHVFGAGKGHDPEGYLTATEDYDLMAYVNKTEVTISGNAFVKGSVYGGSENGHVLNDTHVVIDGNCQIGNGDGVNRRYTDEEWIDPRTTNVTNDNALKECAHWDFGKPLFEADGTTPRYVQQRDAEGRPMYKYGETIIIKYADNEYRDLNGHLVNVSGTPDPLYIQKMDADGNLVFESDGTTPVYVQLEEHLPYDIFATDATTDAKPQGSDGHTFFGNVFGGGSGYYPYQNSGANAWVRRAGRVRGNTKVEIKGGHILTSVYGGCELTDVLGTCTVEMSGGTLGVPRTIDQITSHPVTCYLFGAGKGDQRVYFNKWTNVRDVVVKVSGTALIYGSVFGGGEDGHVLGDVEMTIGDSGDPLIGTWGTSYVDGNIFGGGRGFGGDALTAGNVGGSVTMDIKGGTMLGSIYGGGRLGSVGYGLYNEDETDYYGVMQEDGYSDWYKENGSYTRKPINFDRGHITINISGGTIGNDRENLFIHPDIKDDPKEGIADLRAVKTKYHIPLTTFNEDNQLAHSKGGNVFGGCMGRLTKINDVEYLALWNKLGVAKKTDVTITGTAHIKGSVYGGSEFGTLTGNAKVTVSGGTIDRDVFGGGYGSEITVTNIGGHTPMEIAGRVNGNTSVTISGGHVQKNVYGGGELASVGIITSAEKHENPNNSFAISWPYKFTIGDAEDDDDADPDGNTKVEITGGRVGVTGKDYMGPADPMTGNPVMIKKSDSGDDFVEINTMTLSELETNESDAYEAARQDNGDVFGGGKGLTGDRYEMAYCNNVNNTEVTINIESNADPDNYKSNLSLDCLPGSVYGGAENGHVIGNTKVTLTNGLIGHCIYGGGKGKGKYKTSLVKWKDDNGTNLTDDELKSRYYDEDNKMKNMADINDEFKHDVNIYSLTAGKVYGNTEVTMNGGWVIRNIFGGGNMGSVGKGNYTGGANDYSSAGYGETLTGNLWNEPENSDNGNADFLGSGITTVNIYGGKVGYLNPTDKDANKKDDLPLGNVFGGCRGQAAPNVSNLLSPRYLYCPEFYSGYVNESQVTIGKTTDATGPIIIGSVYGGGQDGHVRRGTKVTIEGGEIGIQISDDLRTLFGTAFSTDLQWLHRGNVYGAGSGIGKIEEGYSTSSGSVTRETEVTIKDGTIYRSVYGGGSLASVGPPPVGVNSNPSYNDITKVTNCYVNIDGGTVGYATNHAAGYGGNVFGASRGDAASGERFGAVEQTLVHVKRGHVLGNVFGGGDAGIVKRNPVVIIGEKRE